MFTAPIYLLVSIVGLWFAIKRRKSFPKASGVAIVGFGILAAYNLLGCGVMIWWMYNAPEHLPEMTIASIADRLVALFSTGALALAVFLDRNRRNAAYVSS